MQQKADFLTTEIMRHRLNRIADEMATTLRRVSGSPLVTDAGDYTVGVFLPDGDLVARSGILPPLTLFSAIVKHIIEQYSDNPGFNDGDMFLFNDPYKGASHTSDVYIVAPIFSEGVLAGWTGSFTHVMDIGGVDFGARSLRGRDVYDGGLRFPGIKLVENDRVRKDIFDSIANMVRLPDTVGLDIQGQIAAARTGRARFLELVRMNGLLALKKVMETLVNYSEDMTRAVLRDLPDGTWREVLYQDGDAMGDTLYKIVMTMTKESDSLTFDFTGTSKQGPSMSNAPLSVTRSGIMTAVISLLGHDIPWNAGMTRPVKVVAPEGTIVNPTFPACVRAGTTSAGWIAANGATQLVSRMMGTTAKYKNEVFAMWEGACMGSQFSGTDETGHSFGFVVQDQIAGGGGARAFADGVDTGGILLATEAIISNVERYESAWPILFVFRRQSVDSGGPGKFRGGVSGEYCVTPYECPRNQMTFVVDGGGAEPALSYGLFGGYPAANSCCKIATGTSILERMNLGKFIDNIEDAGGELLVPRIKSQHEIRQGDVVSVRWSGGGGYGDVLDRPPESVLRDVVHQVVSPECAVNVYDVAIRADGKQVDWTETGRKRIRRRLERTGYPDDSLLKATSYEPSEDATGFSEYLVVEGSLDNRCLVCRKCGQVISPLTENWKNRVISRERPLSFLGPKMSTTERFVLREFYCPGCATLMEVVMTLKDAPPIRAL